MRILLVNKFFWRKGGCETVFLEEKQMLEAHGHDTVVFAMKHPNNFPSEHAGFFVEQVDYAAGGLRARAAAAGRVIYSFEAKRKLELLLRSERIDVAHLHGFQHQLSPSIFAPLRRRNIPIVLTVHDLKPLCPNYKMLTHGAICERCKGGRYYQCLAHRCTKNSLPGSLVNTIEMYFHQAMRYYGQVSAFIAVSRFYRDKLIEYGFSPERTVLIPNSVDTAGRPASGRDTGYGIYFGRLSEEKGVATLLSALKKTPGHPFLIAGSGPSEPDLRERARQLGLTNVTFTGHKEGGELKRLVAESAFSVLPSEWYENCPMSVLESFAAGKPVIGANVGGIPELIDDPTDGLLFKSGNAGDLAEKMLRLWRDPAARTAMGENARRKAAERFHPERQYRDLMQVFGDCLAAAAANRDQSR